MLIFKVHKNSMEPADQRVGIWRQAKFLSQSNKKVQIILEVTAPDQGIEMSKHPDQVTYAGSLLVSVRVRTIRAPPALQ